MTTFVRIDCNLGTILYFTLKRLISLGVCTSTTGVIGQNPDDNFVPPSTSYYVISGRKQNLINAETRTWLGLVTVRAYTYSAVDIAMRDRISAVLTNGTGAAAVANQAINALNMYDMTNGATYFLAQPMRLTDQDPIVRNLDNARGGQGWSYCEMIFEVVYGEDPTFLNPEANGIHEYTSEYTGSFS